MTEKSLQGRASAQRLMTCHLEIIQCLDTCQLGAVGGEEVRLQRDFKTVNRLLGMNVLRQSVPLRRGSDGE